MVLLESMNPNEVVDINTPAPTETPKITPHVEKDVYIAKHKAHIQPVRTFSSDLAQAVREKGGSVVRIAIAEDEKHRREFQENSITSRKNITFMTIGTILVLVAVIGLVWTYVYKKNASTVHLQIAPTAPSSIAFSESNQTIDATNMPPNDLLTVLHTIVSAPNIQSGTVKNIVIDQNAARIPASQFITAIGANHAGPDFLRSLSNEYMLGVYLYNQSNLFLILRGTAHDFLLSGMLSWEPYLLQDLAPLFSIDTGAHAKALDAKWNSVVILNHDARAVLDANNKPLLFYSFLDENTIFIGTDPNTLTTVVQRIQ